MPKPSRTDVSTARSASAATARKGGASKRQGPAVAVVDDDRSVCEAIAETLRSVGCRPTCFTDPARFLDEGDPDRFDCLVLDVRMPGLSGLEVQQELNRRSAVLPVIFISGHGDISMAMAAVHAGALHFLEKPFRDQALLTPCTRPSAPASGAAPNGRIVIGCGPR